MLCSLGVQMPRPAELRRNFTASGQARSVESLAPALGRRRCERHHHAQAGPHGSQEPCMFTHLMWAISLACDPADTDKEVLMTLGLLPSSFPKE